MCRLFLFLTQLPLPKYLRKKKNNERTYYNNLERTVFGRPPQWVLLFDRGFKKI